MTRQNATNKKDVWQTPKQIIRMLTVGHNEIHTDPCAGPKYEYKGHVTEPTKIGSRYNYTENGLQKKWGNGTVFINPPFTQKEDWLEEAVKRNQQDKVERVYFVTPDSTDTKSWWHGYIAEYADYIWFSRGRINYISPVGFEPEPTNTVKTGNVTFGTAVSVFGSLPETVKDEMQMRGQLVKSVRD